MAGAAASLLASGLATVSHGCSSGGRASSPVAACSTRACSSRFSDVCRLASPRVASLMACCRAACSTLLLAASSPPSSDDVEANLRSCTVLLQPGDDAVRTGDAASPAVG
eukprot:285073-Prymnesium_polylepis.1